MALEVYSLVRGKSLPKEEAGAQYVQYTAKYFK